jgi:hypothetical protein
VKGGDDNDCDEGVYGLGGGSAREGENKRRKRKI